MAKAGYKIGEVAAMLNLKSYVLRFWETEFPQLAPKRTQKGQRFYSEADVQVLRRIQTLLYEQGLTIEGARRVLAGTDAAPPTVKSDNTGDKENIVGLIQAELLEIYNILDKG